MASMFGFRMRAYAAAHFPWDDVLTVSWPNAEAKLQSEYTGGEDGRTYPVTIHGEIRGEGKSLEEAEPRLANAIGNTLPLIALASNAAVDNPLAVAAYGLDLTEPQPFLGYQTPDAKAWFPPGSRRIDADAALALMTAVGQHPEYGRLHRAIESYRRALTHWIPEERLLAGEFLFIAAETLSRFLIESRAGAMSITPKNLVRLKKLESEARLRRQYLEVEVFAGDTQALDALEAASNGFEHGYMELDQVRDLVEPVLERAFGHLRRALVNASGVGRETVNRLLAPDYDEPRGLVPVIKFVRGELSRKDQTKPPPAMEGGPIELEWQASEPVARQTKGGRVELTFQDTVKATKLPDNTQLSVLAFGMRAANVAPADEPPPPEPDS